MEDHFTSNLTCLLSLWSLYPFTCIALFWRIHVLSSKRIVHYVGCWTSRWIGHKRAQHRSRSRSEWVWGRYDIIRSVFLTIKEYLELFSCNLIYGYNHFHIFTCYACMFVCNIERIAVICWPEFLWKRGNFCLPLTLSILILSLALINCGHIVK